MISVSAEVPYHFYAEREYVLKTLFERIDNIEINIIKTESSNVKLILGELSVLLIDSFFSQFDDDKNTPYLSEEYLPTHICKSAALPTGEAITCLYGNDQTSFKNKSLVIGCDIIASTFFMLTRWEEEVISNIDIHGRPEETCLASVRFGIQHLPIVDEYGKLFLGLVQKYCSPKAKRNHKYEVTNTHDIDHLRLFHSIRDYFAKPISTIKIGGMKALPNTLCLLAKSITGSDPYLSFDFMMSESEKYGIQSHFFFMTGGNTRYDNKYNINSSLAKETLTAISNRGHIIGLHPSYNSKDDEALFLREKSLIEKATGLPAHCGRQHYLRTNISSTWKTWDKSGMQWDSTVGFHSTVGFKAGTCIEYQLFDIHERKIIALKERPLIFMDVALLRQTSTDTRMALDAARELIKQTKLHSGNFVFLWHNSSFEYLRWSKLGSAYSEILKLACN